jgi:hypothetical protein
MLKSVSHLKDLSIHASDGEVGSVEEFYFDDQTWTIRYVVVNTGSWLSRRMVLISPRFLRKVDWEAGQLHVGLTKQQIENSPNIDTHQPVSRQHETEYMDYFASPYYWSGPYIWGPGLFPTDVPLTPIPIPAQTVANTGDSHLRSTAEVKGYHIDAADGEVGHVTDFIVDQDTWGIRYLEVNTRNWLPGKLVLLSPEWIEGVSWLDSKVYIDLKRETIKSAPEYVESRGIAREYENQLHEHYGRLPYWLRESQRQALREPGIRRTA